MMGLSGFQIYFADSMFAFMTIEDRFVEWVHDHLPEGGYEESQWASLREEVESVALKRNFEDNTFM